MSASRDKQASRHCLRKRTNSRGPRSVRFVPKADLYTVAKSVVIRSPRRTLKRNPGNVVDVGAANTAGLESLGTVAYEPLWWFHRREDQGGGGDGFGGRQTASGPEGRRGGGPLLELSH